MTVSITRLSLAAAIAIVTLLPESVTRADILVSSQETSGNGTFQPAGERPGNDHFFNVEGSGNGAFASWGGARWTGINLGPNPVTLDKISITLGQSNAAFTVDGPVSMWLVPDSYAPQFQEGGSLNFASWASIEAASTHLLDYSFVEVSNGHLDVFELQSGDPGFTELATSVQDGTLAIAWAPESASVAATWGGIGNFNSGIGGARLHVEGSPVPEPATIALTLLGAIASHGLLSRRRHIRRSLS